MVPPAVGDQELLGHGRASVAQVVQEEARHAQVAGIGPWVGGGDFTIVDLELEARSIRGQPVGVVQVAGLANCGPGVVFPAGQTPLGAGRVDGGPHR